MPDISMCDNRKCKINKQCYRFMAIPSGWQSYSQFDEQNCEYFMPIGYRPIQEKSDSIE